MFECKVKINRERCNCTYEPCPRKGMCCECLHYHKNAGHIPACYFPDNIEGTYDRSIENFIRTYKV